jgi:hypothetical protein
MEQLLALHYGVVVCLEDLQMEAVAHAHRFRRDSLLMLVGVVIGERNNDPQFFHEVFL